MTVPLTKSSPLHKSTGRHGPSGAKSWLLGAVASKTDSRAATLSRADYHIGESHMFLYCIETMFYTIAMAKLECT